jgi:ribose/xylose/arabinose/galactoside ABC-type transport system permease subunit
MTVETPSVKAEATAGAELAGFDVRSLAGTLFREYGIVLVFFGLVILATILTGGLFLSGPNLVNVARQISIEAIIAFGMTLVIITGGIDLSVGSVVALVGVLGGYVVLAKLGLPIWLTVITAILAGMSVMTVARGAAYLSCNGLPVFNLPEPFKYLGRGYLFEQTLGPTLPIPVLLMLVCFVFFHVLLSRTTLGRAIYAVGGNEEATRLSGIDVKRVKMTVYVLIGAAAGLAGIILASRLMSGDPKSGSGWELDVIAAVVVGGTSLSGGRGNIFGTLVGALIIGVLNNSQNLLNVSAYWQMIVLGLVILGAVLLDNMTRRSRK